jgi:hypothetical protein
MPNIASVSYVKPNKSIVIDFNEDESYKFSASKPITRFKTKTGVIGYSQTGNNGTEYTVYNDGDVVMEINGEYSFDFELDEESRKEFLEWIGSIIDKRVFNIVEGQLGKQKKLPAETVANIKSFVGGKRKTRKQRKSRRRV